MTGKGKASKKKSPRTKADINVAKEVLAEGAGSGTVNSTEDSDRENALVLDEDLLDLLDGMTDKLEKTDDMAEKVKLHSEITDMTSKIKCQIDGLIRDLENSKIMVESSAVLADDLGEPGEDGFDDFDTSDTVAAVKVLEGELGQMNDTDNLLERMRILAQIQRKCKILKAAADDGELIIRKIS